MVTNKRKKPPAIPEKGKPAPANSDNRKPFKAPPFHKHFKSSPSDRSQTFKVGDSKVWNKETW
jgi:hypothetical protein